MLMKIVDENCSIKFSDIFGGGYFLGGLWPLAEVFGSREGPLAPAWGGAFGHSPWPSALPPPYYSLVLNALESRPRPQLYFFSQLHRIIICINLYGEDTEGSDSDYTLFNYVTDLWRDGGTAGRRDIVTVSYSIQFRQALQCDYIISVVPKY